MAKAKRLIDTSKMKVINNDRDKDAHRITFLDRVEDKGDREIEHTVYQITWLDKHGKQEGEIHQHRQKSVRQKLLCLGGPLAGTRQAQPGDRYHSFNVADRSGGKVPRCVWIHASLLVLPPI